VWLLQARAENSATEPPSFGQPSGKEKSYQDNESNYINKITAPIPDKNPA
jgi:hypothetical protein